MFPYIFYAKICDPWGWTIFDPRGFVLNKVCELPLDVAQYQILKLLLVS
jgi:hypothetical protein